MPFLDQHNALYEELLQYKNNPDRRQLMENRWKKQVRDLPEVNSKETALNAYSTMTIVAQALNYIDFITAQENQGPTGILADYFAMASQFKNEAGLACGVIRMTGDVNAAQFTDVEQSQYVITENALYYFDKAKNKLDVVLAPKDGDTEKARADKAAALAGISGLLADAQRVDSLTTQQQRIITHHLSNAGIGHAGIGHGRNLSYLNDYFEIKAPNITPKKPIPAYTEQVWDDFRAAQKAHLIAISKIKYTAEGLFDEAHSTFNFEGEFVPVPADQCLSHIRAQGLGSYPDNFAVDRTKPDSKGRYPFGYAFGQYVSPGGGMVAIQEGSRAEEKQLSQMLNEHLEEEHGNLWLKAAAHYKALDYALVKQHLVGAEVLGKFTTSINKALGNDSRFTSHLIQIIEEGGDADQVIATLVRKIDEILAQHELSLDAKKDLRSLRAAIQVETFALTPLYSDAIEFIKKHHETRDIIQLLDGRVFSGRQISRTYFLHGDLVGWFNQEGRIPGELEFADDLAGSSRKHLTMLELLARSRKIKFSHIAIPMVDTEIRMENGTWVDEIWCSAQYDLSHLMLSGHPAMVVPLTRIITRIDEERNAEIKGLIEKFVYAVAYLKRLDTAGKNVDYLVSLLNGIDTLLVHEWRNDELVVKLQAVNAQLMSVKEKGLVPMRHEDSSVPAGSAVAAATHGLYAADSRTYDLPPARAAASAMPHAGQEEVPVPTVTLQ